MKMVSFGIDISDNDIYCSNTLIKNVENSLNKIIDAGAKDAKLTNITGDDIVITAIVENEKLEKINKTIYDVLKENALGFEDLNGVSKTPENAGEGISYGEINLNTDYYPDAIIIAFDTYAGEHLLPKATQSAIDAAKGMKYVGDIGGGSVTDTVEIPGVGYVSNQTDDPVILVSVENVEHVGIVAGAMIGAILGNNNTYLVKRKKESNVIPGSVIFTVTAFLNGNVLDLAEHFNHRMRILD